MTRDSFIFYASFYEGMKYLDDTNYIALSKAVIEYALYGIEPKLSGIASGFYQLIKPQIDANNKKYANGLKGAEYGKMGGRPRKGNPEKTPSTDFEKPQENPKETPNGFLNMDFENPEKTPNENVNENVNENELECEKTNFAVADATTTSENDFLKPIEKPASPEEKEKGCAEKEKKPTKTVGERSIEFWEQLQAYKGKYSCEMLQAFYNYWSEHNEGGKKMRWEMQKTWNLSGRLATWQKRGEEFAASRRPAYTQPTAPSNINTPDYYPQQDDSDQF